MSAEDCNEIRKIANYCDDIDIVNASNDFFKKNITIANLKDAIAIELYSTFKNVCGKRNISTNSNYKVHKQVIKFHEI